MSIINGAVQQLSPALQKTLGRIARRLGYHRARPLTRTLLGAILAYIAYLLISLVTTTTTGFSLLMIIVALALGAVLSLTTEELRLLIRRYGSGILILCFVALYFLFKYYPVSGEIGGSDKFYEVSALSMPVLIVAMILDARLPTPAGDAHAIHSSTPLQFAIIGYISGSGFFVAMGEVAAGRQTQVTFAYVAASIASSTLAIFMGALNKALHRSTGRSNQEELDQLHMEARESRDELDDESPLAQKSES